MNLVLYFLIQSLADPQSNERDRASVLFGFRLGGAVSMFTWRSKRIIPWSMHDKPWDTCQFDMCFSTSSGQAKICRLMNVGRACIYYVQVCRKLVFDRLLTSVVSCMHSCMPPKALESVPTIVSPTAAPPPRSSWPALIGLRLHARGPSQWPPARGQCPGLLVPLWHKGLRKRSLGLGLVICKG